MNDWVRLIKPEGKILEDTRKNKALYEDIVSRISAIDAFKFVLYLKDVLFSLVNPEDFEEICEKILQVVASEKKGDSIQ